MIYSTNEFINYAESFSSLQLQELYNLERDSHLKTLSPNMISGKLQGQILHFLSRMINAKTILEIGTFTGYATICLAVSSKDVLVTTIEANPEYQYISNDYFKRLNVDSRINQIIGSAKSVINTIEEKFDLIFMDGSKHEYCDYFDLLFDKLNSGGILVADNVLWYGKIFGKSNDNKADSMDTFNRKVFEDDRVDNVILPIRDGLNIIRKK